MSDELENVIDFSGITPFVLLPEGTYLAAVCEADERITKNKNGNPVLNFKWQILEGDHTGRKVKQSIYFTKEAKEGALTTLLNMGVPEETIKPQFAYRRELLLGCRARIKVVITHSEKKNENGEVVESSDYNNVKGVYPLTDADSRLLLG